MAAPVPSSVSDVGPTGVAVALLAGDWTLDSMRTRGQDAFGTRARWVGVLVTEVLELYRDPPQDRPRELAAVIATLPAWQRASARRSRRPRVRSWTPTATAMGRTRWPVADLPDLGALARLLDIDTGELAWFADVRATERRAAQPLRHYRWRALPKRDGVRLVAAPKPRLKEIQRRLLRHVLNPIALHDAAHGGVPTRSVRSALAPHAGRLVVVRADLEAFFASVAAGRVYGVLRTAGYPEAVAHTITGLCTTVVPIEVWQAIEDRGDPDRQWRLGRALARPHLPQGAPTSPALANLVTFSLDRRLAGVARTFDADYTRYVDDLTFSGTARLRNGRSAFIERVETIVRAEGFALVEAKTVVLGQAGRQQLLGAVVNERPTLPRHERDALRALLHNCAAHGWRTQARDRPNFPEHVRGRVAHANGLDPVFGQRLRALYDAVNWS